MSRVFIHGLGAVSPAGWGGEPLCGAVRERTMLPFTPLPRPGWTKPLLVRSVPPPENRPAFLGHPRLRRSSAITQHAVAASVEAMGSDATRFQKGEERLGVLVCLMSGCVTYSRRFCEEVMRDPSTASPLLFPETVFNAPGSHISAYLGNQGLSYTLVGDASSFLQGVAIGADWLLTNQVDGCLIVGAEEVDWLVADALHLFSRNAVQAGGAGAVYLRREEGSALAELKAITDPWPFSSARCRRDAALAMRQQLPSCTEKSMLCSGLKGVPFADADELEAWKDWQGLRIAPLTILGEAFTASAAWQCVTACESLRRGEFETAIVSVVGSNQQAIGAVFRKTF